MDKYYYILAAVLVAACCINPASAAVALLFVLSSKHVERFLTPNISDSEKAEIQALKSDFQKLKSKVEQESLGKAFRT